MNTQQTAMILHDEKQPKEQYMQLHAIIIDRGSKYSATAFRIHSKNDIKACIRILKKDKAYNKATHNTYAARFIENKRVIDLKNDNKETGAGMIILRELQKQNCVNILVIVTRWFGDIMLHADRFKHVQDATREILCKLNYECI